MDNSLHYHILYLEDNLQSLHDRLTNSVADAERVRIMEGIRAARLALQYYRQAYSLEQQLRAANAEDILAASLAPQLPHSASVEQPTYKTSRRNRLRQI